MNYLIFGLLDLHVSFRWHSSRCELKRSKVLTDRISRHKNCILYYFIWFSFFLFLFFFSYFSLQFFFFMSVSLMTLEPTIKTFWLLLLVKNRTKNQQLKLLLSCQMKSELNTCRRDKNQLQIRFKYFVISQIADDTRQRDVSSHGYRNVWNRLGELRFQHR